MSHEKALARRFSASQPDRIEQAGDALHARTEAAFEKLYAAFAPVECRAEKVGIQRYDNGGKTWIHLLNYRYDEQEDRVLPMETLEFTVRNVSGKPEILVPAGDPVPACEVHRAGDNVKVILRNAGLYTVAVFGS